MTLKLRIRLGLTSLLKLAQGIMPNCFLRALCQLPDLTQFRCIRSWREVVNQTSAKETDLFHLEQRDPKSPGVANGPMNAMIVNFSAALQQKQPVLHNAEKFCAREIACSI